jgi:hypothetical protein
MTTAFGSREHILQDIHTPSCIQEEIDYAMNAGANAIPRKGGRTWRVFKYIALLREVKVFQGLSIKSGLLSIQIPLDN